MTKQEEIREGIFKLIEPMAGSIAPEHHPNVITCKLIEYLDSAGCVLKVDRELPENPSNRHGLPALLPTEEMWSNVAFLSYNRCQGEMLKAGYVAVEPLIEEKDEKP